jgi:hypothetical protein
MITRTTLAMALVLLLPLAPACGGNGNNGQPDADTGVDVVNDVVDADVPVDMPTDAIECGPCATGEACLLVTITRAADDSSQPWVLWPTEADGVGTLIVSAVSESTILARETVADANYVPSGSSYTVSLCVTPGFVMVWAFLDDDGDAASDAWYSADYLDSCLGLNGACNRCVDVTALAGEDNPVSADLVRSCD